MWSLEYATILHLSHPTEFRQLPNLIRSYEKIYHNTEIAGCRAYDLCCRSVPSGDSGDRTGKNGLHKSPPQSLDEQSSNLANSACFWIPFHQGYLS